MSGLDVMSAVLTSNKASYPEQLYYFILTSKKSQGTTVGNLGYFRTK